MFELLGQVVQVFLVMSPCLYHLMIQRFGGWSCVLFEPCLLFYDFSGYKKDLKTDFNISDIFWYVNLI